VPADPIDREPTDNDLLKRGDVKAAIARLDESWDFLTATEWLLIAAALDKLPAELDKASPPAKIAPSPNPVPEPPKLGEDMSTAEMTWRELHDQVVNQSDGSIIDLVTGVIDHRDPRSQAAILWGIAQQVLPELVRDAASEREWGMVSELGDAGAGFDAAMTEYIGEDPDEPPV
jgi:hypothetical protein